MCATSKKTLKPAGSFRHPPDRTRTSWDEMFGSPKFLLHDWYEIGSAHETFPTIFLHSKSHGFVSRRHFFSDKCFLFANVASYSGRCIVTCTTLAITSTLSAIGLAACWPKCTQDWHRQGEMPWDANTTHARKRGSCQGMYRARGAKNIAFSVPSQPVSFRKRHAPCPCRCGWGGPARAPKPATPQL